MRIAQFTRQERILKAWLQFLSVGFLAVAILFAIIPDQTLIYMDDLGATFFGFTSPSLAETSFGFWWGIAVAPLFVLALIAFQAQADWLRKNYLVPVIIWTKFFSLLALLFGFILSEQHFYMIAGLSIDGGIGLITWFYYGKATQSRN